MNEDTERWLPVPGYESLYEISDRGRVWSVLRQTSAGRRGELFLKPWVTDNGYPAVMLWKDGKRKLCRVHSLVLAAFGGACPPGQVSRHGPNGKLDNRFTELRRGTHAENSADMLRDGTRIQGEDHANSKLTEADVCEIRRLAAARTPHQVLAGRFGVSASNISMIVQRKTWSHIITADALPEKGVHRGESHRSAKLTEADVRKIRRLAEDRITQRTIAKQFGISNMAVNRIVRKTAWAHIS